MLLGLGAVEASAQSVVLAAHRAVYELGLAKSDRSAGVSSVTGRLVFEFSGSVCAGYTMNMRFVSRIGDNDGKLIITDTRASTWEAGDGKKLRFNSTQYVNSRLAETTIGSATHKKDGEDIAVVLKKPKAKSLTIGKKTLFPTDHLIRLIEAAKDKKRIVLLPVFDGSETGEKVYQTTAIIGRVGKNKDENSVARKTSQLKNIRFWPVSIGYFDGGKPGEETPAYQLSFDLYENGISDRLTLDYGKFALKGKLQKIEFLDEPSCD